MRYLHDANDGATITREVVGPSYDVSGVEESLAVGPQEHEAHGDDGRPRNEPGHGGPHEEVAHEELYGPRRVDHPGPAQPSENRGGRASFGGDGVVEEAR
ncbi:LOW QUALITY PROTEIN: hypothetical protein TorRG33x02_108950 [Trema orientale]|uniref:Uncharacterized protein n=1 Tax=Trema orientale TaxID=63057 RepID=A0A2P5F6A7_TREOI|nr:LOW QUALITY PROTEIN: hypothetical protein TorRG33x02_108950 [Trema orientale]